MRIRKAKSLEILNQNLLRFSEGEFFTCRSLMQNVSIIGQPGSGKTTSSQWLAKSILRMGGSLLVMCAKPDERALWERYCAETGRLKSLVIFDGKKHRYNFIAAEIARLGIDAVSSVIELIMHVMESARSLNANGRQGAEPFWDDMVRMILQHCLIVIYLATGTITIASIIAFVRSAPRYSAEMKSAEWKARAFFFQCFTAAADKMDNSLGEQMIAFWTEQWMDLDPKTKSNASISLCATLDRFNHGWLREAFTTDTTWTPELLFHGVTTVLDMPALTHMESGILAQRLLKFVSQRTLLARQSYGSKHAERPVVIWMDEAPVFVDSHDAKYLALCRSTLSCMVLIAQSIPSYYAVMTGDNARDRVDQLLGNCTTKVWHCTNCPTTAKIAAESLGQCLQRRANFSASEGTTSNFGMSMGDSTNWGSSSSSGGSSSSGQGGGSSGSNWSSGSNQGGGDNWGRNRGHGANSNLSEGWSEQMGYIVEPSVYGRLKTGGPQNGNRVSAIWVEAGRRFAASNGPALYVEFDQ